MKNIIYGFVAFIFVAMFACGKDQTNLKYKDLLEYGVPIEILAPDSVTVFSSDMGIQKDVSLKGENGYDIQLFYSDAFRNQKDAVEDLKEVIQANPYFKEIIEEAENGFIYSNQLDSSLVNYGFRYLVVKAGKEFIVQPGMLGIYTLEEVKTLYGIAEKIK